MVHRTLSGAPDQLAIETVTLGNSEACSAIIQRTVRCVTGLSGEPVEQWLPARQWSSAKRYSTKQCRDRSQSAEVRGHWTVRCGTGLSDAAKRQGAPMVNCSKP
jgi:ribulose-5-phosphate 4-epimerase/fuculose-1-phosphate aldolase